MTACRLPVTKARAHAWPLLWGRGGRCLDLAARPDPGRHVLGCSSPGPTLAALMGKVRRGAETPEVQQVPLGGADAVCPRPGVGEAGLQGTVRPDRHSPVPGKLASGGEGGSDWAPVRNTSSGPRQRRATLVSLAASMGVVFSRSPHCSICQCPRPPLPSAHPHPHPQVSMGTGNRSSDVPAASCRQDSTSVLCSGPGGHASASTLAFTITAFGLCLKALLGGSSRPSLSFRLTSSCNCTPGAGQPGLCDVGDHLPTRRGAGT